MPPAAPPGDPAGEGAAPVPAPAPPAPAPAPAPADGGEAAPPAPAPAPPPAPPAAPVIEASGPVGSACRALLRPDIPSLVIEVDVHPATRLPQGALDHLVATLRGVLDKPGGITVEAGGGVPADDREWSLEEIRTVAAAARDVGQSADVAALHVLALPGEPDQDDDRIAASIGIAFDATSFVVFPDRVDSLALLLGGAEAILRSVLVHEAGHLLCLVNISYESELAHEDPEHPGHSADQGSVMFYAVETTAVGQLFSGPPPSTFADADLADLEGLRTGRY